MYIHLTDAPGNFEAVYIDVREVKVHSNNSHPQADWIEMKTNQGIYDLLQLTNGKEALIANGELPEGPYHTVRIKLGPNNSVVVNGAIYPLQVPGSMQSGLKIDISEHLKEDEEVDVLLDFDVQMSIVNTGQSNYILNPVIRAIIENNTGKITGKIEPAAANPVIYAVTGNDSTSVYPDNNGEFKIRGLVQGVYQVVAVPQAPYNVATVPGVLVKEGEEKDIGVVQLGQ